MRKLLVVLSLCALLPACATNRSRGGDNFTQQVRAQLVAAGGAFESRGYSLTHEVATGSLDDGQSTTQTFNLAGGGDYRIMGACDTDCSDLDLTLFDGSGREISEDVAADDVPIVGVVAPRSGRYVVRVTMADCDVEPCRYGVMIYGK